MLEDSLFACDFEQSGRRARRTKRTVALLLALLVGVNCGGSGGAGPPPGPYTGTIYSVDLYPRTFIASDGYAAWTGSESSVERQMVTAQGTWGSCYIYMFYPQGYMSDNTLAFVADGKNAVGSTVRLGDEFFVGTVPAPNPDALEPNAKFNFDVARTYRAEVQQQQFGNDRGLNPFFVRNVTGYSPGGDVVVIGATLIHSPDFASIPEPDNFSLVEPSDLDQKVLNTAHEIGHQLSLPDILGTTPLGPNLMKSPWQNMGGGQTLTGHKDWDDPTPYDPQFSTQCGQARRFGKLQGLFYDETTQ
jgi:hypothetical protein